MTRKPPHVRLDVVLPDQAVTFGSVSIDEPLGSMSSDEPTGRRVILFGWLRDDVGVWESRKGFDLENMAFREVVSADLRLLSDLTEPYEVTIHRNDQARLIRFTAVNYSRSRSTGAASASGPPHGGSRTGGSGSRRPSPGPPGT